MDGMDGKQWTCGNGHVLGVIRREAAEAGEGLADISFDLQILLYPPILYIHPHSLISASH